MKDLEDILECLPESVDDMDEAGKLILCFVAESERAFYFDLSWHTILASNDIVDVVNLLYNRDLSNIAQIRDDGTIVTDWINGEPVGWTTTAHSDSELLKTAYQLP